MNHEALYVRFIQSRRNKPVVGYSERHHIIPRCEGGSNDPENLVRLSARDHLFAHLILAKWKGGVHWAALMFVSTNPNRKTPTAQEIRIAAKARGVYQQSAEGRAAIAASLRGRKLPSEQVAGIKERMLTDNPFKGRTHSDASKARMAAAKRGRSIPPEQREKIRASVSASLRKRWKDIKARGATK